MEEGRGKFSHKRHKRHKRGYMAIASSKAQKAVGSGQLSVVSPPNPITRRDRPCVCPHSAISGEDRNVRAMPCARSKIQEERLKRAAQPRLKSKRGEGILGCVDIYEPCNWIERFIEKIKP